MNDLQLNPEQNFPSSDENLINASKYSQLDRRVFLKSNILWWLLSLILVLVAGIGYLGFKYFQLKQEINNQDSVFTVQKQIEQNVITPTSSASSITMMDSDWKTYENLSLGFRIKYPSNVEIEKVFDDQYNRAVIFKGSDLHFEVMLRKQPENFELSNYKYLDNIFSEQTNFKNRLTNIYEFPNGYCDGPECSEPYVSMVFTNSDDIYHLNFFGDTIISETEKGVLDSFEFMMQL